MTRSGILGRVGNSRRQLRLGIFGGLQLLCLAAVDGSAQWDFKLLADYRSTEAGSQVYRTATQQLVARRKFRLGQSRRLQINATMDRSEEFEVRESLLTGFLNADYRGGILDLFYQHRPTQRQGINQPADRLRKETAYGGSVRLPGLPLLTFRDTRRRFWNGGIGQNQGKIREQRLGTTWTKLGVNLDYSYRRTTQTSQPQNPQERFQRRLSIDHGMGASASRRLFRIVTWDGNYRFTDTFQEWTGTDTRRIRFQRGQSSLRVQPWQALSVSGSAAWQETRTATVGRETNTVRSLNASFQTDYQPTPYLNASLARLYQVNDEVEGRRVGIDNLRAQLRIQGNLLPELRSTASLARSWNLSSDVLTTPSNQLDLTLVGTLRPGAEFSMTTIGHAFEGVPASRRYQVSQSMELRLRFRTGVNLNLSNQSYRLGSRLTLRHMDRSSYRVEGLLTDRLGRSMSLAYSTQLLKDPLPNDKYRLAMTLSAPWKGSAFSWTTTLVRAGAYDVAQERAWGYVSSTSARIKIRRGTELNIGQTRTIPTRGHSSSSWSASFVQRLR